MPTDALTLPSLEVRRTAIAAAFRAVREEPEPVQAPTYDDLAALRASVEMLAERVERVEDKVELSRDGDEVPLAWPAEVSTDSRLEVPPLSVSRASSPAFDILMGSAGNPA